jgi:hypothetical protein
MKILKIIEDVGAEPKFVETVEPGTVEQQEKESDEDAKEETE